jgi:hypothetical protein
VIGVRELLAMGPIRRAVESCAWSVRGATTAPAMAADTTVRHSSAANVSDGGRAVKRPLAHGALVHLQRQLAAVVGWRQLHPRDS